MYSGMKKQSLTSLIPGMGIVYFLMCFCTLGFSSCSDDYDDTELRKDIDNLENRVTSLEEWQSSVNTNIQSLQSLVAALESRNYITDVTTAMENGEEVGYTITFQAGNSITIRHGKNGNDGKDGKDGADGATPVIGVLQDTDGTYYWTLNGEFLTDGNGNKIPVTGAKGDKGDTGDKGTNGTNGSNGLTPYIGDNGNWWIGTTDTGVKAAGTDGTNGNNGQTPYIGDNGNWWIGTTDTGVKAAGTNAIAPQVRINPDTNIWEVSTDEGNTWVEMKDADGNPIEATGEKGDKGDTGAKGDAIFSEIDATSDENKVTFKLVDGTTFIVPRAATTLTIIEGETANTFTVTSELLIAGTGNVVHVRVESENADGTTILTRIAVETRWTVESSITNNVLTITAKPANTVKLDETALLKVTISDSNGNSLASGQKVFRNGLTTSSEQLKEVLKDEAVTSITLAEDLAIENALSISSDKEIDLNGKTLTCDLDGTTIFQITEGNVSFSNGTIKLHNTYKGGNVPDIVVGVDKSHDKSDLVVSTATATFNNVKLSGSIYVSYGSTVEISESEITSELYGICTNAKASSANTSPVTIKITDTKLIGETPVFINVPATLEMDNCTVIGGWQGVMMRGGTATISNSTISLSRQYATAVEGDNWTADKNSGNVTWSSGNEVAIAGITMGNNTTSAYQYPTSVTLKNTSVAGYEGYWAVYADATSVCTVNFTYDSQCIFSPSLDEKSFNQGKNANSGYITVVDGNGTTSRY